MPRLPDRVVSRLQPASTQSSRLATSEVSALSTTEARSVARQAIDAVESREGLAALATKLQGEAIPAPLSSLNDLPAGRDWLAGTKRIGPQSPAEEIKVVQRALMKIGAHHTQGRTKPELMLLPWGADGSLGQTSTKALETALRLANRADLIPLTMPLKKEVAQALEGLLRATPQVQLPPQNDVFPTTPTPATPSSSTVPQRLNAFGGVVLAINASPLDTKWKSVLSRMDAERSRYTPGAAGNSAAANTWLRGVDALRGKTPMEQLVGVNRLVNDTAFQADAGDVWKTPLEFFAQRGDCEDYSIAKYASLKKLGFDESRMRLLIVTDTVTRQQHAVLAVDMPDATYILDNVNRETKRQDELKYPSGEWHYQPMFALSRSKQWLFGRPANPT